MKLKTTILTMMALSSVAYAEPLYVYRRDANEMSGVHPGEAIGTQKQVPVLINIYGRDAMQKAYDFGRDVARHHYSFSEAKHRIIEKAVDLYQAKQGLIQWFEQDAAHGYDAEMREERR